MRAVPQIEGGPLNLAQFNEHLLAGYRALIMRDMLGFELCAREFMAAMNVAGEFADVLVPVMEIVLAGLAITNPTARTDPNEPWNRDMDKYHLAVWRYTIAPPHVALRQAREALTGINSYMEHNFPGQWRELRLMPR